MAATTSKQRRAPPLKTLAAEYSLATLSRVRVAVVSDSHGQLDPRIIEAVRGHDCVVHAGDVGGAKVLEQLRTKLNMCVAVRGNNDTASKWPKPDLRALESLPESALLHLPGGTVAVIHGDRFGPPGLRHQRLRNAFPAAKLIIFGHSHRRCVDKTARPWVANPGAAGRARAYGGPGLLTLTAGVLGWRLRVLEFERR